MKMMPAAAAAAAAARLSADAVMVIGGLLNPVVRADAAWDAAVRIGSDTPEIAVRDGVERTIEQLAESLMNGRPGR
jgi:hypothetical protein